MQNPFDQLQLLLDVLQEASAGNFYLLQFIT